MNQNQNSQASPHKTEKDLRWWGNKAWLMWEEQNPQLVARLEKQGTLFDSLAEAQDRAESLCRELKAKGLSKAQINELVVDEICLPPDEQA